MAKELNLYDYIANIVDFPKEGIIFRDVTPLLQDAKAFHAAIDKLAEFAKKQGAEVIMGPEARGMIFGSAVAYKLGVGFVPVRKPNKLPREVITESYDLEYGSNTLCIHSDSLKKGQKVVIIDDLLATGGTIKATINLAERLGAEVVGCGFLIDLVDLKGRDVIKDYEVCTLLQYEGE